MTLPDAPVGNTPPWAWASIPSQCNGRCLTVDAQDHGGAFCQQTENQNMRMASTTKSDETIGGHAHFLVLSLLAILRKITKNNEQQTTVPLSLLTTHLRAIACLSGKSAGGRGEGARTWRRTWARPGRCRNARARPGHPNRAWAMQGGSGEACASEQGLGDAGRLVRGMGISTRPGEN